jgi:hypothetical protein
MRARDIAQRQRRRQASDDRRYTAGQLALHYGERNCSETPGAAQMSKGIERKKETKKKPAKSLMEKRAAKAAKRNQKKPWGAP